MNYCSYCGFKIEGEINFCPNCGSKLEAKKFVDNKSRNDTSSVNICRNCGEVNAVENLVCFSCGVSLTGKKQISKGHPVSDVSKHSVRTSDFNSSVSNENEKTLDNKKIVVISVAIIVIFTIALVISNVFNNVNESRSKEINNQSSNS